MKKIFCVLICIVFVVLAGCGDNSREITPVTSSIKFTAKIEYNGIAHTYRVNIDEKSNTELIAKDSELKGMSYYFSGDKVTERFNKLEHEINLSSLPEGIIIDFIHSVFKTVTTEKNDVTSDNGQFILNADNERYNFKMFLGETGIPIKIEDKENGITAIISDAAIIRV